MTWIKICGMTNLEDALLAVDAGADAVGFVFYEKSPRCVTVETAREIISQLPEEIEKIGVFVDPSADPIGALLKAKLTGTQSYISAERVAGANARRGGFAVHSLPRQARFVIAFPMSLFAEDVSQIERMAATFAESRNKHPNIPEGIWDTFLVDSGNPDLPGGTGKPFDWNKAGPLAESMRRNGLKLIVAGGLRPENVREAVTTLSPWGVDVASGVESRPGKKDPEKVRAFVRAVREYDRKAS